MDPIDENYEGTPFVQVVLALCHPGRDDNSKKTAAVASALVEVIQEKLGADSPEKISPAALFASTLNALTSTITSDTTTGTVVDLASSPQLPLLEILRQVVPYVSSSNPNLYLHQFNNTSRALRGVIASIPTAHQSSDQSKISTGWNALLRQCIRTASTALNGILVLDNARTMEKEVLKCFHSTILQHFDDSRAKVRRQAQACALELLHLSNSLETTGLYSLIPDHMCEYSHHILASFMGMGMGVGADGKKIKTRTTETDFEKKDKAVRLLHLLSFLDSSLLVTKAKGRLTIGQDLMKLLEFAIGADKTDNQNNNAVMVANGALTALLQIFDNSNREVQDADETSAAEDAFCAQKWAALLQANGKVVACTKNGNDGGGECRTLYARCIVAITIRLISEDISEALKPVMKALVPKLLPLSFTTIINCVGDEDISQEAAQSICAELGRLIRSEGLKSLLEEEVKMGGEGKCMDACVAAMHKILHYRYKTNWDGSLPCLASLVVTIVHGMIPPSGSDEATLAKMQSRVKPLVGGLVQLYADVDDKGSKQIVEFAIGTIVEGVGAEIFMGLVNLGEGPKDSNVAHGAVSNERAWLLNVIKSSLSADSSPYRPRLAFFQSHVLGLARKCDAGSAGDNLTAVEASIQRSRVLDLWCLFPSFCLHPLDIELTFPTLAQTVLRAMGDKRYPELLVSLV